MNVIDGRAIARKIIAELKQKPKPQKALAAVFVGDNPQSQSFLKQKEKMAKELGIDFQLRRFPDTILEGDLILEIKKIGADKSVGGMIVQLPLPKQFNRDAVVAAINPEKDVDALTLESQKLVDPLPVAVVKDILRTINKDTKNKTFVVVGRGFLVGKPIADYFKDRCGTLIRLHNGSDLSEIKKGNIVITGVGKAGLITANMVQVDAVVIDFGYDLREEKIAGDFDPRNTLEGWYTPTPGGTGPMLVAEIFRNFYYLNGLDAW